MRWLALWLLAGTWSAHAQVAGDELATAPGARLEARAFVGEGQAFSHGFRASRPGCVGFFALGGRGAHDIDLRIYSTGGQQVAEDVSSAPIPYARVCVQAGVQVYVEALLYAGRGEVTLFRLDAAPRQLPAFNTLPAERAQAGGALQPEREIGDDVPDPKAEWSHQVRELQRLGYQGIGAMSVLDVRAGQAQAELTLAAGKCYRVAVFIPAVRGLLMTLSTPPDHTSSGQTSSGSHLSVPLCLQNAASVNVAVRGRVMRGLGFMQVFEHSEGRPSQRSDSHAAHFAEVAYLAGERGFSVQPVIDVAVDDEPRLATEIALGPNACGVVGVVSESESFVVDMRLVDERGVVIGRNEGRASFPLMFWCTRQTQRYQLFMRSRRSGSVTVVAGQSPFGAADP